MMEHDLSDELARLEEQLRVAFEGPAWHGPAVLELLGGVDAAQAAARPVPGAHTIWEIVLHLGATYGLVLRRLRGDPTPLTADEDWPPAPAPTAAHWEASIAELRARNRALRAAVRQFDPDRLTAPLVAEPPYGAYTQLIGLTQHDAYHAGQIALLERAIASGASPPAA